ncbi:MAG: Phosphoenolpyruvate synthase [Firmicutes bacterium]|nr:Phosphoenolpyruvate synthase [Bacillota bacterium]
MGFVYSFNSNETPELVQVGGKGMSLILMTRHGLPVPPGFVLSMDFFKPWFDHIKNTPEWQRVINSAPDELKMHSAALKRLCAGLKLDEERRKAFVEALDTLEDGRKGLLFAVRSSSPEEDLEGASFAGGYETTLGVNRETIEDALRRSFASCLDERVFVYKKEHGFPVDNPRIAVIVQVQVPSETAGVAFSLNPINNCYDEAVINANFGLGESVVSGAASPDTFIVDKVSGKILEKKAGRKETSVWLAPDGGTYEKPSSFRQDMCLKDGDVLSLVNMLMDVEKYYKKFVDIEWAFAGGKPYLLQARPITAYIPLHEEMQTAPGRQKLLYLDTTLAKQGIHEPLSVMGADYLSMFEAKTGKAMTGKNLSGIVDGTGGFFQGRMYLNISNNIKLYGNLTSPWTTWTGQQPSHPLTSGHWLPGIRSSLKSLPM